MTANPVQTSPIFRVKKGFFGYPVVAGNPLLSWKGFKGEDRECACKMPPDEKGATLFLGGAL